MDSSKIQYKIKTVTEAEILQHLQECSNNFAPPLEERVNLQEYAKKVFDRSTTFEAWNDRILVGFIAVYLNKEFGHSAFITSVSISKRFMGLGIASELLRRCICHARKTKFKELRLEVNSQSSAAIRLYRRFGFVNYEAKDDVLLMRREIAE